MKNSYKLIEKLSHLFQRMKMGKTQKTPKGHEIPILRLNQF